ncbi:NADPH:quinone oxidoreductase family protein [Nocardia sp. NPDC052254]|uniref:NADPH:quinone oxidoreductase family protein n=1 Tax=Nocardia sp. NPDC052254 TaxID=3155681 RepID=UPI00342F99EA
MRALVLSEAIGPRGLRVTELPEPAAADRVIVDVRAAGVSYPDLLQTQGRYQTTRALPFVPGVEAAGTVRCAPEGSGFEPGARVAVLTTDGAWQQVVAGDPRRVLPLPDNIGFAAAAGMPMNHLTAHFALLRRARVQVGELVLVHGAAGGLGQAALALCRALGLRTIAVVSTQAKGRAAIEAGADHVVAVDNWLADVRAYTDGTGVDVVIDPVGGDRFTDSLRCLSTEGRIIVLGFTGGSIPEVKVNRLLLNNTGVLGAAWGEFLRNRTHHIRAQWDELYPMLADERLRIAEPELRPLAEAGSALGDLGTRTSIGKLVLDLS